MTIIVILIPSVLGIPLAIVMLIDECKTQNKGVPQSYGMYHHKRLYVAIFAMYDTILQIIHVDISQSKHGIDKHSTEQTHNVDRE